MIDYYGDNASYIHCKFGDMRKMYNFTDEFRKEHPTFCEEYEKYWNFDKDCKFKSPMEIANYVQVWGIPVHFYFNYTDTPAKSIQDVKDWIGRESLPSNYAVYDDDFKMTGWDGEVSDETEDTAITVTQDGKSRTFNTIEDLVKFIDKIQLEAGIKAEDTKVKEESDA